VVTDSPEQREHIKRLRKARRTKNYNALVTSLQNILDDSHASGGELPSERR
jgi:hypothetical protein